jgi:ABC-2 type transport system ATP-binding protein
MENTDYILEAEHITKSYGSLFALKDTSLRFSDNNIYGLFGRNGAGKTSLLNILSTRLFADNGTVRFLGEDCASNPKGIAENCCYMPEKHYFPPRLSIKNLLLLGKSAYAKFSERYADELCRKFKLNTEQKYGQLSRGYQSIFRIVLGLASKTAITIFDEPVLGLDAAARDLFYSELIEEFSLNPRLFIISTNFIEEAADLFNEAIIIHDGKVIGQGTIDDLLAKVFYVSGKADLVDQGIQGCNVLSSQTMLDMKTAVVEGDISTVKRFPSLSYSPLTIQKLFIHLTNDQSKEEQER